MDLKLLSRITKNFLTPSRKSPSFDWSNPQKANSLTSSQKPKLPLPEIKSERDLFLSPYFSKGGEIDEPSPIPYLIEEPIEIASPRLVPGNLALLKSLCRGKGILRRNERGMIYLDIDDRFISMLLPYLSIYGLEKPPYFNLFSNPEGAHIPVILPRETSFHGLTEMEDLGKEFSFEIEGLYSTEPASWPQMEQVWFFKVVSQELEEIRRKHFLSPILPGKIFQITVAVKPTHRKPSPPLSLMRINRSFIAA